MKEFILAWDRDELVVTEDRDVTIGRNPGSDIYYADKRLSREHALISLKDGILTLEDLGSSNGTLLNNRLIKTKEELHDRDRVVAGPLHITIRIAEKEDKKEEKADFRCPNCAFSVTAEAKFCPDCGESLEGLVSVPTCRKCKAELVPGALFCPQCGDSVKEIVLDQQGPKPKGDGSGLKIAELGPRLIAGVIDLLIVAVLFVTLAVAPAMIGYIIFSDIESGEGFNLSNQAVLFPGIAGVILFILVFSVLFGYFWGSRGKSPGMAVSGIRVADLSGGTLGFGKGILRALISLIIPGWFMMFISSRKQTLHDIVAGSMVII